MLDDYLNGLALLETSGGAKTIKGPNGENSHNLYNIKDFKGGGYKAYDKAEGSRDAYRTYNSPEESKADLLDLLKRKYPAALQANSPEEFAKALKKGGYATDPLYVTKLSSTIKTASTTPGALKVFANQGWDKDIAAGRAAGFTDEEIAAKIKGVTSVAAPAPKPAEKLSDAVAPKIAQLAATGADPARSIDVLREAGWGNDIDFAREKGFSDADIVAKIGGDSVSKGAAARKKVEDRGFMGNLNAGTLDAREDVIVGGKQLWAGLTGDKKREAELRQEQQNRQSNLDRIALTNSTAASIGSNLTKAAPSIAGLVAAPITAGASLPVAALGGAAGGALGGALQPTTEDGQRATNALVGGALGAAGPAVGIAGRLAGKGVKAGVEKAVIGRVTPEIAEQRIAKYAENGISNPTIAEIYPNAARAQNFASNRLVGSTLMGANKTPLRTEAQQKLIRDEIGVAPKEISTTERFMTMGPQAVAAYHTGGTSLLPGATVGQGMVRYLSNPNNKIVRREVQDVLDEVGGLPGPRIEPTLPPASPIQQVLPPGQNPTDLDPEEILRRYLAERLQQGQ